MAKISIGKKEILRGLSIGDEGGVGFGDAQNTFGVDIFRSRTSYGLLRRGFGHTSIGSGVISDVIEKFAYHNKYYGIGSSGYLYQITDNISPTVTELDSAGRSGRSANFYGIDSFYDGSSEKLHWFAGTKCGVYDYVSTFSVPYTTGILDMPHPTKLFQGVLFFGNGGSVGKIDGTTLTASALTIPTGYIVTGLEVYQNYLAVLINKYPNTGTINSIYSESSKLLLWDTYSSDSAWQAEYNLNDCYVNIAGFNGALVLSGRSVAMFSGEKQSVMFTPNSANVPCLFSQGAQLLFSDTQKVVSLGAPESGYENVMSVPFYSPSAIRTFTRMRTSGLLLLSASSGLFLYDSTTSSNSSFTSTKIDLSGAKIRRFSIVTDVLSANDGLTIKLYDQTGVIIDKTISYSTDGANSHFTWQIHSRKTDYCYFKIDWPASSGGDVKIREVIIDYDGTDNKF